jgi:hypothetical protein
LAVVNRHRPRLGPRARRSACQAAKATAGVAVVVIVRALLGVWAAAVLVALAALVGLIAGWAAVEARAFDRRHPSPPATVRTPGTAADRVAFARALAAVAAAYLTACERQEHPR